MTVQAAVLGSWPSRITRAGTETLLAVSSGDNAVQVVNARTLETVRSIDMGVGANPWQATPYSAQRAIVSNWLTSEVRRIDWELGLASSSLQTSLGPEGVTVRDGAAYVACTGYVGGSQGYGPGHVDVVDLDAWTIVASVEVGRNPQDLCVDEAGRVHVLCTGTYGTGPNPETGSVHILDPLSRTVVDVVPLGGAPGRLAPASGDVMWVAGFEGGVRRYDASTGAVLPELADPTLRGGGFSALDWDATTGTVWITHFDQDLLLAIDGTTGEITGTWLVGDGPSDVLVVRDEDEGISAVR
jgi:hypothetical protein